jgi:hypothetical protein
MRADYRDNARRTISYYETDARTYLRLAVLAGRARK